MSEEWSYGAATPAVDSRWELRLGTRIVALMDEADARMLASELAVAQKVGVFVRGAQAEAMDAAYRLHQGLSKLCEVPHPSKGDQV